MRLGGDGELGECWKMPPQSISSESPKMSRSWAGEKGRWAKVSRAEGIACAKAQRKCSAHLRLEGLS